MTCASWLRATGLWILNATRVAGPYARNQRGHKAKKGVRGIRILAPVIGIRREKDEEAKKDIRTQNQAVLVGSGPPRSQGQTGTPNLTLILHYILIGRLRIDLRTRRLVSDLVSLRFLTRCDFLQMCATGGLAKYLY